MARAARKAKAKPAGKRAPASGKQRKYSRDNNGRFASTGTGATARGGRLLTAKGNKRKTQTITAVGKKGVIGKPKGLKPGGLVNSAAKRREANSVRKGNRVLTTDADRRNRAQSLATAERALTAVKASPSKGRNRLTGSDSELKAAEARVAGLKGPMPNSRKVNRSEQAAANRNALARKGSEQRNAKTMADFTAAKGAAAKPAAKPAAAKPAAAKKPVRTDGAAFAERNKRTSRTEVKRSLAESDRDNALSSEQRRKTPVAKRMAQAEEKTARAKRTAAAAKEFYRNYGSESTFGRRPRLSTAGGAKFGAKVKAKKPAARKPAAKPVAPKAVKANETQRNIRNYMDQNRGSVARDMKRDAQAFRQPLAKKDQKPGGPKTVGGALEALASKSFNRVQSKTALTSDESRKAQALISDNNIKGYRITRTSRGDILERTSGVSSRAAALGEAAAGRKATRKPVAAKPTVSARGRSRAPEPVAPKRVASGRTRAQAAAAQRNRNSQIKEKTSSQVIGARRGVRRTAASGNRSEVISVTKTSSKQGNLLTGKTDTTKHVKARIVPRNGGSAPGSKGARRSFGRMMRKMETEKSMIGRKQARLRGIEAAREKLSPGNKKKLAKTIATRGKADQLYVKNKYR